jgi:hypothetical protein
LKILRRSIGICFSHFSFNSSREHFYAFQSCLTPRDPPAPAPAPSSKSGGSNASKGGNAAKPSAAKPSASKPNASKPSASKPSKGSGSGKKK